uniref:TIGR03986 family type III CRISPR-associated RAMP protein n=1 Tax=Rhabdothermincola sp. TaxID=2820405 RepID=UPI002FE34D72
MPDFDGTLTVARHGETGEPVLRVRVPGESRAFTVDPATLDEGLQRRWQEDRSSLEGQEVTFEMAAKENGRPKGGKAKHVRPTGAPRPERGQPAPEAGDRFVNPYTFVPAPPRKGAAERTELGDRVPWGHHRRHPDGWSGRIRVRITTTTPLLIPDASAKRVLNLKDNEDHQVLPLRLDPAGRPYLPPTSVKGMLRAAYEAVTNSRFGIFDSRFGISKDDEDQDHRLSSEDGPGVHGNRILKDDEDQDHRLSDRKGRKRKKFEVAPGELLDPSLRPATTLKELSPADRVFGWVNQTGHGAYRGQLRVGPVTCTSAKPVERFDDEGVPLAILSTPKPEQARFYAAADQHGTPVPQGADKSELYVKGSGLRGRKVYVHHAGLGPGCWENPTQDRTQQGPGAQEYRRPDENGSPQRDNQNRSITAWVRPGAVFETTLSVENLSDVELGALLWLLNLPEDCHHRLGGGKPLGFGSVRIEIDQEATSLAKGSTVADAWRQLDEPADDDWSGLAAAFEEEVRKMYPSKSIPIGILEAFLQAARGPVDARVPVHYPRLSREPDPEGRNYEWFNANEQRRIGGRWPLPLPGGDLPLDPTSGGGGGPGGGHGRGGGGRR